MKEENRTLKAQIFGNFRLDKSQSNTLVKSATIREGRKSLKAVLLGCVTTD